MMYSSIYWQGRYHFVNPLLFEAVNAPVHKTPLDT